MNPADWREKKTQRWAQAGRRRVTGAPSRLKSPWPAVNLRYSAEAPLCLSRDRQPSARGCELEKAKGEGETPACGTVVLDRDEPFSAAQRSQPPPTLLLTFFSRFA